MGGRLLHFEPIFRVRAALEIPTAPTIANVAPTVRLKVRPNHRFDVRAAELVLNEPLIEQLGGKAQSDFVH
jgi:hypothetical protein